MTWAGNAPPARTPRTQRGDCEGRDCVLVGIGRGLLMISRLIVNPPSVRPYWPLSIRMGGSKAYETSHDPTALAQDFEFIDTYSDEGNDVVDARGVSVSVIMDVQHGVWLAQAVGSMRHYLRARTLDERLCFLEFHEEMVLRTWSPSRRGDSSGLRRLLRGSKSDHGVALPMHWSTPCEVAVVDSRPDEDLSIRLFHERWCEARGASDGRMAR